MIALVHLVWGPLGPTRLRAFLASYRNHPAGVEHRLVVLFNGVSSEQRPALLAELEGVEHSVLTLDEPVLDLAAYGQAAARLEHERLCFMNSYSLILAPNWLAKLDLALSQPGVGVVGATGSWASLRSWQLNLHFLPNPYRGVVPERTVALEQFQDLESEMGQPEPESQSPPEASRHSWPVSTLAALRAFWSTSEQLVRFKGFPAVHVRTNAFMVEHAVFARFRMGRLVRKMDAYRLESGRNSLTHQVHRMGMRPLVVDRDGVGYECEQWPTSLTFWQRDQEGLLIADKQTRAYANGALDRRRLLSALAWGRRADPRMPISP